MSTLSRNAAQALAILTVDNIRLSKAGMELFTAVDTGEMTIAEAKEAIKTRARAYGSRNILKTTHQSKNNDS